ncbi:RBBP9/YdeN family alpha/beta hydrolase [Alkanindiges illinoisensis]|nr:alpha/beta hydrolase [Alkanindiges illinoisensis]
MKRLIVPGVSGSEAQHWQSWLQQVLPDAERVEQQNWHQPILQQWVGQLVKALQQQNKPVQIVAHSFGCLTSIAALKQHPELASAVDSLILVAPANPERFSSTGLRQSGQASIAEFLPNALAGTSLPVPSLLIASQTDPWLDFESAKALASQWQSALVDLGNAGHINVASGFGAWPQLLPYLDLIRSGSSPFASSPVRPSLNHNPRMRDLTPVQQFQFSRSF